MINLLLSYRVVDADGVEAPEAEESVIESVELLSALSGNSVAQR